MPIKIHNRLIEAITVHAGAQKYYPPLHPIVNEELQHSINVLCQKWYGLPEDLRREGLFYIGNRANWVARLTDEEWKTTVILTGGIYPI